MYTAAQDKTDPKAEKKDKSNMGQKQRYERNQRI